MLDICIQWNTTVMENNEIFLFSLTWMHLKDIMISELSQRNRNIVRYHIYMWNLKCKTNITCPPPGDNKKNKFTNTESKQVVASGARDRMGVRDSEVQSTMYKINKLQGYRVEHKEYRHFYNNYKWNIPFKNCDSPFCTPGTYTVY